MSIIDKKTGMMDLGEWGNGRRQEYRMKNKERRILKEGGASRHILV